MKIIVGLGNPGRRYEASRHNVGMMVVDLLADEVGIEVTRTHFRALVGMGRVGDERVLLVKPMTMMNLSGEAVAPLVRMYKVQSEDVIVIHDDMDLALGRLRLKPGGGDGGHRGIRSIIDHLGTDRFTRLKIGIGRPPAEWETADYVLATFGDEQWELVRPVLIRAAEAARELLSADLETVMNKYNR